MRHLATLLAALALAAPGARAQGFSTQVSPPRFEASVKPGAVFREVIEIANVGQTPARLSVSTADWTLNESGAAVFSGALAPGSCRPWTALEATELEVGSQSRRRFRFEVRVPADAADGQCRFAIMFEGEPTPMPNGAVPVAGRIGIIVYLDIGAGAARLRIVEAGTTELDGATVPFLRVANDGNAHGRLQGFLDAVDATGKRWTLAPAGHPILPGASRVLTLTPVVSEGEPTTLAFPVQLKGRLDWRDQRLDIDARAGQ